VPVKKKSVEPKAKTNDVYVLHLSGQGDTYIKLVDQETWDWIFNPWNPPDPAASSYDDSTVPPAVLKRMKDMGDEFVLPNITRGSYENDRALQVAGVFGETFFDLADAMHYIKKHDLNVLASWEGCIY
jgi:hypothetical protein